MMVLMYVVLVMKQPPDLAITTYGIPQRKHGIRPVRNYRVQNTS